MFLGKKIACIIPARLQSSRFPRKVLMSIAGKPILQWVWESASKIAFFDHVVFAVDAEETATLVSSFNAPYVMTSPDQPSGTDRIAEAAQKVNFTADIWVNWQGDEPLISEQTVLDLLKTCTNNTSEIWTLKQKITQIEDINSPQIAKVVCNEQGFALYFSRSAIPFYRDNDQEKIYFKHIGMYAFTQSALNKIATLPPCFLENAEKLEQLRWLEHKLAIMVNETNELAFGIDFPHDLAKAEALIEKLGINGSSQIR